jgi:hypothetical protein
MPMFQVSCQIGESEEWEDFDLILGIIFDYVVQVLLKWQYSVSKCLLIGSGPL